MTFPYSFLVSYDPKIGDVTPKPHTYLRVRPQVIPMSHSLVKTESGFLGKAFSAHGFFSRKKMIFPLNLIFQNNSKRYSWCPFDQSYSS
jgi:hypothetical protein